MTDADLKQWENEVFTRLVIDLLKQQRAEGRKDFLLDKYEIDQITKDRLRILLSDRLNKKPS